MGEQCEDPALSATSWAIFHSIYFNATPYICRTERVFITLRDLSNYCRPETNGTETSCVININASVQTTNIIYVLRCFSSELATN